MSRAHRTFSSRRFTVLALLTLILATPQTAAAEQEKIKAVTTFTVIADIARNVAGDAAIVESITKPGAEIHDYQPTPQDIIRAQGADIILWNGMNLERWFERFLQDVKDVPSVVVSDGVEPISIYEGPYTGKPNPHAWMSTENAILYVDNIRKAFIAADPANADIYNKNASAYTDKIRTIKADLTPMLDNIPKDQRYLVTSEGAFSYLARDLKMKEVYLWPINADQQGTPQQVRAVIDRVREKNIPVVFSESTISDRPAKQVASETGAAYGGVLYVDSLSEQDGPVPTYLDLLKVTTHTIAEGFQAAMKKTAEKK
ncbi:metal ABC transporter substrate-binding protein [Micavibrio aeruginosavorus]|uniref:Manganese ABC transporter, periplasmic-binding protein SitA n=1 Tax=Micavibrio aeruginosavorus EPB TaxID=349215 RepID=M4VHA2_9BACT|nr:metal ABC transporter substrate-binding protein [Micavibrio aeruginosavorus]AGH98767.1 Manganese ABC transporter, periplasmic-binding protein SitA [Micavibrio aeruginosavorus EPB]